MRVFKFDLEEKKCPECNWETSVGYVVARGESQAEELLKEGVFLCGNCLADTLVEKDLVIAKEFDPDDYPDYYFPNWFEKEHFEWFLDREITDEEFQELKENIEMDVAERVSEIVSEYLEG